MNDMKIIYFYPWMLVKVKHSKIVLYSCTTRKQVQTYEVRCGSITTMCISPDEKWLYTGTDRSVFEQWDIMTGKCCDFIFYSYSYWQDDNYYEESQEIQSICMMNSGRLYTLAGDKVYDGINQCNHDRHISLHTYGTMQYMCASINQRYLFLATKDQTILRRDVNSDGKTNDTMIFRGNSKIEMMCASDDHVFAMFVQRTTDSHQKLVEERTIHQITFDGTLVHTFSVPTNMVRISQIFVGPDQLYLYLYGFHKNRLSQVTYLSQDTYQWSLETYKVSHFVSGDHEDQWLYTDENIGIRYSFFNNEIVERCSVCNQSMPLDKHDRMNHWLICKRNVRAMLQTHPGLCRDNVAMICDYL